MWDVDIENQGDANGHIRVAAEIIQLHGIDRLVSQASVNAAPDVATRRRRPVKGVGNSGFEQADRK